MKKKVLVVEDFASVRAFVCEKLNGKGYETIGAANIKEAVTIITQHNNEIGLVITDYTMPDGTGYELLKNIKENSVTTRIPVMFLTTESSPDKMRLAKDAGLTAWVKKPYRGKHFFHLIEAAVGSCAA
jgi:two-component system, chemotaxis family, chemotaxis protein CheY